MHKASDFCPSDLVLDISLAAASAQGKKNKVWLFSFSQAFKTFKDMDPTLTQVLFWPGFENHVKLSPSFQP